MVAVADAPVSPVDSQTPVVSVHAAAVACDVTTDRLRRAIREQPAVRALFESFGRVWMIRRTRLSELRAILEN